jgi:Leucine-rich repeat (LRR) protein
MVNVVLAQSPRRKKNVHNNPHDHNNTKTNTNTITSAHHYHNCREHPRQKFQTTTQNAATRMFTYPAHDGRVDRVFPWYRMAFIAAYFFILAILLRTCAKSSPLEDQLYGFGVEIQNQKNQLHSHSYSSHGTIHEGTMDKEQGNDVLDKDDVDEVVYGAEDDEFSILLEQVIMDAFSHINISSLSQLYSHNEYHQSHEYENGTTSTETGNSNGQILHNLNTPQGKAFHWLLHHDKYTHKLSKQQQRKDTKKRKHEDVYQNHEDDTRTSIKLLQRYILTVFFFSTNGEYNTNLGRQFTPSSNIRAAWTAYGSLRFLSERDVCRWNAKMSVKTRMGAHTRKRGSARERYVEDGVHSNDNGHKLRARTWTRRTYTKKTYGIICDGGGQVIAMNLQGLGISGGSIPAEIGLLYNLKKLDLRGNYLTGTVPNSIGGINAYSADDGREEEDFVLNGSLEYLDLSANMLVGPVPDALGSLTHLESLFLHSNRIHGGKIPSSLCTRSHGGDGDDDDRDSTNGELNFSGRDLWADCGRKFDAVFCECCTYCCDSSSADCEPNDGTIRGNASAFTGGLDESENKFDDDAHHL